VADELVARADTYGAQAIFIRPTHAVVGLLENDRHWVRVYEDPVSVIFIRDGAENAEFLARAARRARHGTRVTPDDYVLR